MIPADIDLIVRRSFNCKSRKDKVGSPVPALVRLQHRAYRSKSVMWEAASMLLKGRLATFTYGLDGLLVKGDGRREMFDPKWLGDDHLNSFGEYAQ